MANTYSQIFLHLVFAVKHRRALIPMSKIEVVHGYMASVINNSNRCKAILVGGVADHVHILIRLSTIENVAELVKSVKVATAIFINREILPEGGFAWQDGYGVFSVSPTHTNALVQYIKNQAEHHLYRRFTDEYEDILKKNGISYEKDYLFTEPE